MDRLPEDAPARLERLESWGEEQRQRLAIEQWLAKKGQSGLGNRLLDRGLHTSVLAREPEHDHPDRVFYAPSAWHVLPRALYYLGVSGRDTFVDFGCGKGRVVHQAARWPFRRVIGVEISPVLAEFARATLAAPRHWYRCKDVQIVVSDVTQFRVPDDLTIGYFFNPFTGETFDAVLQEIVRSIDRHPRRVRLIYVLPVMGAQVLATGRFRLIKEQRGGLRDRRTFRAAIFESY